MAKERIKMEIKLPYHECSSFNLCSVNVCPLDPFSNEKEILPGEDKKCRGEKPMRQRIALKYPNLLPYQGLTKRQFEARQKWDALPPEKKEFLCKQGIKALKSQNRLSQKQKGIGIS